MEGIVLKIAVIGDAYTGKSSLCRSISNKKFKKNYISTIGLDYLTRIYKRGDKKFKFFICDCAGHSRFSSIIKNYVKENDILIFCYSGNEYSSYLELVRKYNLYKDIIGKDGKKVIIVATKIDSEKCHHNFYKWGQTFAREIEAPFITTSALKRIGMLELINTCVDLYDESIKYKYPIDNIVRLNTVHLGMPRDKCYSEKIPCYAC